MSLSQFFFFLLLVFLPTQLGLHFWPDWTMVLGRRVDYLSPTVYFTDVLLVLTLTSWFIEVQLHKVLISNLKFLIKRKNFQFLIFKGILFMVFVTINILVARNRPEAVYKWIKILEFIGLGWYIIKTKPKLSAISYPLSLGVLYSSFLAITQFFLQHSIGGLLWWIGERTFTIDTPGIARINWCSPINGVCQLLLRPYATLPHPNVLAGFLVTMIPILIAALVRSEKKWHLLALVSAYFALAISFSRSGWIVGSLVTVVSIISLKIKHIRAFSFIVAAMLFVLLVLVVKFNLSEESIVVRERLNGASLRLWQESPIFGVGLGNFLGELPRFLVSRDVYFLQPVHNMYLLILTETGLMGLGLFGYLLYIALRKKNIHSPIALSLGALLILGFFDHYPLSLQQGQILFTVLLSLAMVQWRHD